MHRILGCLLGTYFLFSMNDLAYAEELKGKDPTEPKEIISLDTKDKTNTKDQGKDKSKSTQEDLELSAILMKAGSRIAIINGQVVKEGDTISDRVVTTIKEESVTVLADQGYVEIFLLDTPIKSKPNE